MTAPLALVTVVAALLGGVYITRALDGAVSALVAGDRLRLGSALGGPVSRAAFLLTQERVSTERPDPIGWPFAPALYFALAAVGLAAVPVGDGAAASDLANGLVLWGAVEVGAIVAVFLHGWSANSMLSVIGGYRFIAIAISYVLLGMFVLIGTALPAESLRPVDVVVAQQGLWNVIRQPLGLPLWLVVTAGVSFWGPLNLVDASDLAGGTSAEASGARRLVWQIARTAMLVTFSAIGATAFLGGWMGPWLPGPVWLALRTLLLIAVVVVAGHLVGRPQPQRFVIVAWTVLLPLAFLDLAVAGVLAL